MADIGYASILTSTLLSIYCIAAALLGLKCRRDEIIDSAERAAVAVFAFLTLAAAVMFYALATRNFQIEYVARYTSRSLPMVYTLAAFYAGQQGSLLFWAWALSLLTAVVIYQNKRRNRELMPYVLAILAAILFFFTWVMTTLANPFKTLSYMPANGMGLNPLLQNPGMLFHPPALLLGYVGFTIPFAFALAALITGQLGSTWIKTTRKWTLVAWAFLTAGNLLGMAWAYVVLGWGGYWNWDPVENASFMPWILGTAYLHSVMIQEKRDMLKVWNIGLIIFTFLLTIFGTFITRSGVIASVHAFGESGQGWLFWVFLLLVLIVSLSLLIYRLPQLKSKNQLDSFFSRESSFLINNLVFVGIAFTVFWGTLFPIVSEAIRGVRMTVGPPFYDRVITPIGLALLLLTGICPTIAWRKTTLKKFFAKLVFPLIAGAFIAAVLLLNGIRTAYALMAFSFCTFVAASLFMEFFSGTRTRHTVFSEGYPQAFWNLVTRNKRRYAAHLIHFGVVMIFMAFAGNAFTLQKQVALKQGESFQIKNYTLRLDALSNYPTALKNKTVATLTVFNHGRRVGVLTPEKNFYRGQEQPTTEVAIHTDFKEDLYVILAGHDETQATIKAIVSPLVIWLWLGGGVMCLGTIVMMWPDRRKRRRSVSATAAAGVSESKKVVFES